MASKGLVSFVADGYGYGFRRDAHQLVVWGHEDVKDKIDSDSTEEEITGAIVDAIRDRLDTLETYFDRYSVAEEMPLAVEGRVGKARRRLDIAIEDSKSKPRSRYVFEAKRLKKNAHSIGDYVGKEGLLCFVRSIYATLDSEAAMLGYVQSGTVDYWAGELKRRFDGDKRNEMLVLKPLKKVQVEGCPDVLVSEHERKETVPITLCHLFVDCS